MHSLRSSASKANTLCKAVPRLPMAAVGAFASKNMEQVRHITHHDLEVPDFDQYRPNCSKDPTSRNADTEVRRKGYKYLISGVLGANVIYATKGVITPFIASMGPSAGCLAGGKIEINLADIPEGKNVTFSWRKRPLFVKHRTAEEIDQVRKVDVASLRDPQSDEERVKDAEWLVVIGVCTHLGCPPIPNAGEFGPGGYFCPCHGSHYDASGRVRKGPAPLNLEVPEYEFAEAGVLVVG